MAAPTSRDLARIMKRMPLQAETMDGLKRSVEGEEEINGAFRALAGTAFGADVLAYLREITLDTVLLPSASEAELRHMEGMRALYAIIESRARSLPR